MNLHLTSEWFINPGSEPIVLRGLAQLALDVQTQEPGTLTYLVHVPSADPSLPSLPPPNPQRILFFEIYVDAAAFQAHVNGPLFKQFVQDYGSYFVSAHGSPYTNTQFLTEYAGFVRPTLAKSSSP